MAEQTVRNEEANGIIDEYNQGNPQRIRVLMYHRIVDDNQFCGDQWTCLALSDFKRQLRWLDERGFSTITFADYSLFLEGKLTLPKRPVILTFDDGYLDTYLLAYPNLMDFGMKAVVFALGDRKLTSSVWDRPTGNPTAPLMDAEQLFALHRAGFEIGGHSMTHVDLTKLGEEDLWFQIARCKILLEVLIDSPVKTFAYPYGLVNDRVKRLTEEAGYSMACSVYSGPVGFGEDHFDIRRISINRSMSLPGFAIRTIPTFQYYTWLYWKTKTGNAGKITKSVTGYGRKVISRRREKIHSTLDAE